ncbi:hypothetical protein CLV49_3506 [Labedella gwakjiensis]|uniref:DUF5666 domain-containing protein n=1 Tax=Labedella gwakjiensis TaxID=390269 RepID=A0A2P8H0W2_9MICO|nr:hypothetical protein [Labedella gwakjiensis]PSL39853.1 hypothetical protein CLV49_3506 [Labedella gwakjiensis]RUQ85774.1 hypothetical protein ELQ93_01725 [Labedella gwakjiensis]
MTPSPSSRTLARGGASIALIAAGALFLAGCSSDSSETSSASSAPSAASDQQMQAPSGVSGLIASISDGTMQVQGTDEQNAVSYGDSTTVSETVSGDVSSIVVGSCVLVTGSADGDDESATVTAESVTVSEAVDGECTGGFGGGMPSGDLPTGDDGEMPARPSGAPADGEMPSGAPTGAGMGGGIVVGLVSAVDGDTVTVESSMGDESTTRSVVTTDDSSVTTTVASDASALEVGRCVVVQGDADDAGTVEATALTVSDAVDGECTTGMPGGFGGRPGSESTDD